MIEEGETGLEDPETRSGQPVNMGTSQLVDEQPQYLDLEGP